MKLIIHCYFVGIALLLVKYMRYFHKHAYEINTEINFINSRVLQRHYFNNFGMLIQKLIFKDSRHWSSAQTLVKLLQQQRARVTLQILVSHACVWSIL